MSIQYLLDTNTVSYILKGKFPRIRERLLKVPLSLMAVSAVTEAESRFGVARLPQASKIGLAVEEFLVRVPALPWDSAAAAKYGQLRAALEREGSPMGNMDLMIAAHALATGMTLVTSDRVFRRVEGLKIEDWTKA